ncbi:MAG: transketolase C-terminal domain-containing protein [Candidatus Diapherotrites archaeon]
MNEYKKGDKVATRDAYGEALAKLGEIHEDIVVLDADLAKSTKSIVFGKKFPERFRYIGISEADMVSMAAGLARCNKVPFVSSFASFLINRALDQIKVSIAYSETNVKIVGSHGGIMTGQDGPTGQSILDLAIMKCMPKFKVCTPSDYYESIACTFELYETKGPTYMRTCREKTEIIHEKKVEFKFGKAEVLKEGKDASIISCGPIITEALKASEDLEKIGYSVSVLNCASLKPIDEKAIEKEAKKGIILSLEDGVVQGLGGSIAEIIAEKNLNTKLIRLGLKDSFAESGNAKELLEKYKMDSKAITERLLQEIKKERK